MCILKCIEMILKYACVFKIRIYFSKNHMRILKGKCDIQIVKCIEMQMCILKYACDVFRPGFPFSNSKKTPSDVISNIRTIKCK